MNSPEFDRDGYPTERTLQAIEKWPADRLSELAAFVCAAWSYPERAVLNPEEQTLYLSTGGWSGNESIVSALENNLMFWGCCWEKSQRGGHYWFDLERLPK